MTFDQLQPVTVGDLVFDVRTLGPDDGEPVVLLHGFPETSLSWSAVAPVLADAGFRVIAPDQRGYSPDARPRRWTTTRWSTSSTTSSAWPTHSASTRSTSSATTGARRSRGRSPPTTATGCAR